MASSRSHTNRTPPPLNRYRYARAWWAGLLGSPALLAFVFAGLLALMVYALGFIPLLSNGCARAGTRGMMTHLQLSVRAGQTHRAANSLRS